MVPILAIASVVSATAAVIKGAVWLADQMSSDGKAGPVADKGAPKPGDAAASGPFQAALSAQMAGQTMPGAPTVPPISGAPTAPGAPVSTDATVATLQLSKDDVRARVQAGMTAYGRVGERHAEPTGLSADRADREDRPERAGDLAPHGAHRVQRMGHPAELAGVGSGSADRLQGS